MKLLTSLAPLLLGGLFWVKNIPTQTRTSLPLEICDNGIDDDGDGLIDLNDTTDCNCPLAIPASLIPNPSFEERNCCPQDRSELYCAKGWIQASEPTTDFLHTCGWMGWPDLPPPLPFPDGEGCMGFRNGKVGASGGTGGSGGGGSTGGPEAGNPNWKEYAGACLLGPLKAGTAYTFEFWIGFTKSFNSPPTTIVFYGTTDCANLPFGINDETFGCPTNGPGWVELGSVPISGVMEWKKKEINIIPNQDIYAIAIGPNCEEVDLFTHTYYFFDNLVLAETEQFGYNIKATGNPCDGSFALNLLDVDTLQYQWYRDGVALVGETGATIHGIQDLEGEYQVKLVGPNSCKVTPPYTLKIPVSHTEVDTTICFDDALFFDGNYINKAGQYLAYLKTWDGCDSIVQLNLHISAAGVDTVYAQIFESESYQIGKHSYSKKGEYDEAFKSYIGCDSLVHLVLDFYDIYIPNAISPNDDGINDFFTIFSGADVKEVLSLEVYDRWGGRVFNNQDIKPNDVVVGWDGTHNGKPASTGVYVWKANIVFKDGKARELTGTVTLIK
ncbi:MAG: T9SS type B sorting domain-containing protein [Bacteroidetes bacterium]|nr:T9SS type B sorting domain-containing protein [Bacteroidota bacterium]